MPSDVPRTQPSFTYFVNSIRPTQMHGASMQLVQSSFESVCRLRRHRIRSECLREDLPRGRQWLGVRGRIQQALPFDDSNCRARCCLQQRWPCRMVSAISREARHDALDRASRQHCQNIKRWEPCFSQGESSLGLCNSLKDHVMSASDSYEALNHGSFIVLLMYPANVNFYPPLLTE